MKRSLRIALAAAVIIAAFFGGYKLRPRLNAETLITTYAKYFRGQPSHKQPMNGGAIETVMATDYRHLIGITNREDAAARRAAMAAYIFRGEPAGLSRLPDRIERDIIFPPLLNLSLSRIDRYSVEMPFGVNSEIFHLVPQQQRGCLMIYQEGHLASFLERKRFLKRFTAEGCDVLALSLPLTGGVNSRPEIDHPRFGRLLLNDPGDLELLDSASYSSLSYFITPLVAALNQALSEQPFDRIGATGFSGGGWAVQILAALDPRIQATYSVAGSSPLGVHAAKPDWGSPEQRQGRFYEIATYTEIYVLAADNAGRRHLQYFNETDPCCFSGHSWDAWKQAVAERAAHLGGEFHILTYASDRHALTKPVALAILDDFVHDGHGKQEGIIPH
jgi:dienelactone hydrolase